MNNTIEETIDVVLGQLGVGSAKESPQQISG